MRNIESSEHVEKAEVKQHEREGRAEQGGRDSLVNSSGTHLFLAGVSPNSEASERGAKQISDPNRSVAIRKLRNVLIPILPGLKT